MKKPQSPVYGMTKEAEEILKKETMTDNKKEFYSLLKEHGEIIGSFDNEYGETFIVYTIMSMSDVYVSGDEVAWQFGLSLSSDGAHLYRVTTLSKDETESIAMILDKYLLGSKNVD